MQKRVDLEAGGVRARDSVLERRNLVTDGT